MHLTLFLNFTSFLNLNPPLPPGKYHYNDTLIVVFQMFSTLKQTNTHFVGEKLCVFLLLLLLFQMPFALCP